VKQFEARIADNRAIAQSWRELVLEWEPEAGKPEPGQFLTLRVSPYSDPLLRRPFAFSDYSPAGLSGGKATVSIVYQIRGGATKLLSELAPGSTVDAIGPLGRGFSLPDAGEEAILAGGGIGLGPLLYLAKTMTALGAKNRLILGLRSAALLPSIKLPKGSVLCTDDGSSGFKGTPIDWLSHNFPEASRATASPIHVYGCGPAPMLAALSRFAAGRGWKASLSAEQWMACGVGACMGCALPRPDGKGYLRACADGPVFESGEIDWEASR
jgi:2-polyprenylphenol hydroxylase and related flavodoxin oxidoreductases